MLTLRPVAGRFPLLGALALVGVTIVCAACEDVGSEDIKTNGMFARYVASAEAGGTTVTAALSVGGGSSNSTKVELVGDDKLSATVGAQTAQLAEVQQLIDINVHQYAASFTAADADVDVTVALTRSVDDGAPASTVKLPTLTAAQAPSGTQARATAAIEVRFAAAASDESTTVQISGDCFQSATQSVDGAAATSVTFAAGALQEPEAKDGQAAPTPSTCEATVAVTRVRHGTVDAAFGEGGTIDGVRSESSTFSSAP